MNPIKWFRRTRPQHSTATPAPLMSREDVLVTLHWGYTPAQWAALDNPTRRAKRNDYYQAVGF